MEEIFAKKYLSLDFHFNMQWNRHVVYALAKTVAKNILSLRARELGIDYNYVNHSHVMGPGDEKDSFLQVSLQKIILGEDLIVSSGEQYFDVISLSDCVRGYKLICQKGLSGFDYWVGSGEAQRLKSYLERLRRIIPSDSQIKFGELAYNDVQVDEIEFSIDLLTRHTGYSPEFSFEETVLEVVKYLEKHNYTVGF
jgi:nucleoside-diphosphate-sugar epimerase